MFALLMALVAGARVVPVTLNDKISEVAEPVLVSVTLLEPVRFSPVVAPMTLKEPVPLTATLNVLSAESFVDATMKTDFVPPDEMFSCTPANT